MIEAALSDLPLRLYCLQPPYRRLEGVNDVQELCPDHLSPGAVLGVEVIGHQGLPLLPRLVPTIRSQIPVAPVVLVIDDRGDTPVLELATLAAGLQIRTICAKANSLRASLRSGLTQPADLGFDVVEWLTLRGVVMSPSVAYLVREIFSRAHLHPQLSTLLSEIGASERTARYRFRRKHLPPPRRWHTVARALHVSLRIQSESDRALLHLAMAMEYTDHSALSKQIYRSFGVRPGEIRGTYGWEWLLSRWLTRQVGESLLDRSGPEPAAICRFGHRPEAARLATLLMHGRA